MPNPVNKINWTPEQLKYMVEQHSKMTNSQLADTIGLKVTSVRTKLYEMGFYKMRLEYWTDEQVEFLKANYKTLGDTELAEIFNQKWHKDKGWDKKHIEKKRRYLVLKRTIDEKKAIHQRNVDLGCFSMCAVKAWKQRGVSPDGTIRFWKLGDSDRPVPHIKVNGKYIHWNRWFWEQNNGSIPDGHFIVFVGDTSILTIENLRCISVEDYKREFNEREVVNLSDGYVASMITFGNKELRMQVINMPDLITAKRTQLLINRKIKQHGTEQNRRS
ncbi:hypothetical protein [Mucilaginibacter sp. SP1R1]|uniref:hypothetical protein n=1 Tax=Mucilaginibacter sp. SP1R1 TaxID=2723091 RepID=UPI00160B4FA9|nr:hypothetical protein [Mucilaginibacter sp. SP1R1]MBB6149442.1 hypothetical protein [Mucilaginibacter sp. SP1R1]